MSENFLHAGLMTLFVALCLFAATEAGRENATAVAAQRGALVAAQQSSAPRRTTQVAMLQAQAAPAQAQ